MPSLQKKPEALEKQLYFRLPDEIKDILGGPDNVKLTTNIIKSAELTEEFRPYINTIVFGLFIGELNPTLLIEATKEWLALDDARSQMVAMLIKKTFVDPHYDFLTKVYNLPTRTTPLGASVPQGNVVNLRTD